MFCIRRIAGIGEKQAKAIIEYRNTHGCFINREELLEVKGIGKVTYNNCAGFVRITPSTNVQAKHASSYYLSRQLLFVMYQKLVCHFFIIFKYLHEIFYVLGNGSGLFKGDGIDEAKISYNCSQFTQ